MNDCDRKYLKKKEEIENKYKNYPMTYQWFIRNKHELFTDFNDLLDLYAETEECKQLIEKYVEKQMESYVNYTELGIGERNG